MKKASPNSKATGEDLGKKAEAAAKFANQFFERLAAAARLDGRALDPLFGDLAEEEEEVPSIALGTSREKGKRRREAVEVCLRPDATA